MEPNNPTSDEVLNENEFEGILNEFDEAPAPESPDDTIDEPGEDDSEPTNEYFSDEGEPKQVPTLKAEYVLSVLDVVAPVLLVVAMRAAKKEAKKQDFKLTATDKESLVGPLQDYLNSLNLTFDNPLYGLIVALTLVYASKVIDVASKAPTITPKKSTKKDKKPVIEL